MNLGDRNKGFVSSNKWNAYVDLGRNKEYKQQKNIFVQKF